MHLLFIHWFSNDGAWAFAFGYLPSRFSLLSYHLVFDLCFHLISLHIKRLHCVKHIEEFRSVLQ